MTDFDLIDTELPPPVECEPAKKIRTVAGTIVSFDDIGGGGGGGDLPQHQVWSELSRVDH